MNEYRIDHGSPVSGEELIARFRPLLSREVERYMSRLGDLADSFAEDLWQVAAMGLPKAASSFDPAKSPAIVPYLRRGIDMAIRAELSDNLRLIRLPRRVLENARKLRNAEGDDESLMEQTGFSRQVIATVRKGLASEDVLPLDSLADPSYIISSGSSFEDGVVEEMMLDSLSGSIESLGPEERFVIKAYSGAFGAQKLPVGEIARRFSSSPYIIEVMVDHIIHALRFDLSA